MKTILQGATASTLLRLAACLAFIGTAHAAAPQAPAPSDVPVATFFDPEAMSEPVMAPDGSAVAILARSRRGHRELAIIDTADPTKINIAAAFSDADVVSVHWVNSQRLIFRSWSENDSAYNQQGSGLFAVDRDGSAMRTLIRQRMDSPETGTMIKDRSLTPDHLLLRTLDDGSNDVMIVRLTHTSPVTMTERFHVEITGEVPMRLDTRTGFAKTAIAGRVPDHAMEWLSDNTGRILATETQYAGAAVLLVPDGKGDWAPRAQFSEFKLEGDNFNLEAVGSDGKVYVTQAAPDATAAAALYTLDLATGKPSAEPVVSLRGFDYDANGKGEARLIEDTPHHRLLGVRYTADGEGTAWFDPTLKALQARLDERLPGMVNLIDPASCACAPRVLVTAFSDRQPPVFYLYDAAADTLVRIGQARPAIDARSMADTDFVRIAARDGQEIPTYVTKPHGKGPWPTVVLVHGGPQVRGWTWEWDDESQFLASRGYLVVKPEFRGSEGYGARLFQSGFKQWGLKSEDDIADATAWAAKQGLADPKRTCIAGASYGGYATLMGLVRYGDLYQCGVAWAAVADIGMMYDLWYSDTGDEWRGYGMPVMIGDPVKDAAQFAQTSPLQQVARIKRPLLLAHGTVDRRVPIAHAYAMKDALVANHAPVTWIEYAEEAHGWYRPQTRIDFYQRMADFLDASIGQHAPAH